MPLTVGLDIGTSAVRAAAVDSGKARPVLRRFAEMPLEPDVVVGGEIMDEASVTEAVAALWKRAKLPKKRVIIGAANQRVVVRQVDVPQMEESELREALPFQVQDSIPIPVDEALLDYVPVEEFVTPEGEAMMSLMVVAAQRDMIDGLLRVADGAGLTPQAVDLQPFALVRAVFGWDFDIGSDAQGILDIGATMSQIIVVRGGVPRFVRILPKGGNDFTMALVDGLGVDFDEAEELKRATGINPEGDEGTAPLAPPSSDEDESDAARRILSRQAEAFIEEVRSSVGYYMSQAGEGGLERLIVAGNGARLPHLANRLGKAIGSRVEPAKVLEQVELGKVQLSGEDLDAAQPVLPTAIGLALWGTE